MKRIAAVLVTLLSFSLLVFVQKTHADEESATLFSAARNGNIEQLHRLLKAGIDVNARNGDGMTALMIAAAAEQTEMVKQLIESGADVNAKIASYDITALKIALSKGDDTEIARILRNAGAREEMVEDRNARPSIVTVME